MRGKRSEIITAMANLTAARIRDWAEDNLPLNHKLRVIVRDIDSHVETTIQRYNSKTKRWSHAMFVFPGAANESMIDDVLIGMVAELSSKP